MFQRNHSYTAEDVGTNASEGREEGRRLIVAAILNRAGNWRLLESVDGYQSLMICRVPSFGWGREREHDRELGREREGVLWLAASIKGNKSQLVRVTACLEGFHWVRPGFVDDIQESRGSREMVIPPD